tara:strand:- start:176 stop:694 length:519 start_codon:yes stop_codon:yes gene_type:complete
VVVSGPDIKKVMTKSSNDSVNARSELTIRAGLRYGRKIFQKICFWLAPRSKAASSWSRLNVANRARIMTATNGKLNKICAQVIFERLSGQGKSLGHPNRLKKTNRAMPIHISGMIMGIRIIAAYTDLKEKRNRHNNKAVKVPSIKLNKVLKTAIDSELKNASIKLLFWSAFS